MHFAQLALIVGTMLWFVHALGGGGLTTSRGYFFIGALAVIGLLYVVFLGFMRRLGKFRITDLFNGDGF